MTLADLEQAAQDAIRKREALREQHPGLFSSPAPMQLLLRRDEPKGNRVRLAGRFGPYGEFLASPRDGEVLAVFDAATVLAWAKRARRRVS